MTAAQVTGQAGRLMVPIIAGLSRKDSRAVTRRRERKQTTAATSDIDALRAGNADLRQQLDNRRVEDAHLEGRVEERNRLENRGSIPPAPDHDLTSGASCTRPLVPGPAERPKRYRGPDVGRRNRALAPDVLPRASRASSPDGTPRGLIRR